MRKMITFIGIAVMLIALVTGCGSSDSSSSSSGGSTSGNVSASAE